MDKFYLTTPIYYVNANPHIGHAYTTLAADVLTRHYRRQLGREAVFFLTGTDEHGAKIAEAAQAAGMSSQQFCDQIAPLFAATWRELNIEYSQFIRTTNSYHMQGAQQFISQLKSQGALYEGDYCGLYCTGCESFLTERQLDERGFCPDHKKPPQKVTEKNWFFKLSDYLPQIKILIENDEIKISPPVRKQEVLGLFKQGIEDFSVSRPQVEWGIPLPWDKEQTIYVWVEALLNYWTAVQHNSAPGLGTEGLDKFWPPDLHLMAKDIIKFHCLFWPAMLLAYYKNDPRQLPRQIFAHGFFTINGEKMSKTLGNVIDPSQLVHDYGDDGARYLILSQFPFGSDGDIEASRFKEKFNADLANGIGNLVSRTTHLCLKQINDWADFWSIVQQKLPKQQPAWNHYQTLMSELKLYDVLKEIMQLAKENDQLLASEKPWSLDATVKQEQIIGVLGRVTAAIDLMARELAPFLPKTAEKITAMLNIPNQKITLGSSLFPKVT